MNLPAGVKEDKQNENKKEVEAAKAAFEANKKKIGLK